MKKTKHITDPVVIAERRLSGTCISCGEARNKSLPESLKLTIQTHVDWRTAKKNNEERCISCWIYRIL